MHANDIASVTTETGNTLYDIETGSLVTYPSPTRLIAFSKDTITRNDTNFITESVSVLTRMIKEINCNDTSGIQITDLTKYGREHSLQPTMIVDLLQGAVLNDLLNGLVAAVTASSITTSEGNTDTGSLALIEGLLPIDSNDLGNVVTAMLAAKLADTMDIDLAAMLAGVEIDPTILDMLTGAELGIYFDTANAQVVIKFTSPVIGDMEAYISRENLKTHMINKAFTQLDTSYIQNTPFMRRFFSRILLHALTTDISPAILCNKHTIIDAAVRAYLGHLGGEELQPEWITEITNGLDITTDGVALNYIIDNTLQYVLNTELSDILDNIKVDLDDLITGSPILISVLPIYFGSDTPSLNTLFSTFDLDMSTFTGSLNNTVIPDEYKSMIGDLFISALNSFLVDENFIEDNVTTIYWEDEVITLTLLANNNTYGTAERSGIYPKESTINITATPNSGYGFLYWNDGITDNPRTVTVLSDTTFTAIFDIMYRVNLSVNDNARGTVTGSGNYAQDSTATIEATANENCRFLKWSDEVTENPRDITVISDTNIIAIFDIMYSVNVSANDSARGTVTGSGDYAQDSTATIEATANSAYHFVRWSDANVENPRTITVTSDTNFIAEFELMNDIADVAVSTISIYPNPVMDNITVVLPEGESCATFTLYDMQSKVLMRQEISNWDMVSVSRLAAGIYIYSIKTEKRSYQGKLIRK
jgi:hypothetical protein